MFCSNCGNQLNSNEKFCSKCGTSVQSGSEKRFCYKCGKELGSDERFCTQCGADFNEIQGKKTHQSSQTSKISSNNNAFLAYFNEYKKSLPSFIIGLIGSILGMFGGLCTTMCSCGSASNSAFLYIFGGAVIGLIGSCMCLNKARIGSILQFVGVFMIIWRAYSQGVSEFFTIFSFVLLLTATVISIVSAHLFDLFKKK